MIKSAEILALLLVAIISMAAVVELFKKPIPVDPNVLHKTEGANQGYWIYDDRGCFGIEWKCQPIDKYDSKQLPRVLIVPGLKKGDSDWPYALFFANQEVNLQVPNWRGTGRPNIFPMSMIIRVLEKDVHDVDVDPVFGPVIIERKVGGPIAVK